MTTDIEKRFEAMKVIEAEVLALNIPLADERRANKVFSVIGEGSLEAHLMLVVLVPLLLPLKD